ncbi:MAG: cytochrome c3 family protein [Armatimonadota bacterium]|nr:cytochrome c3 family protein [Armatimonadota bacterium]
MPIIRFRTIVVAAVVCVLIAGASTMSMAQAYKGADGCKMCHQFKNKPIVEGHAKTAHAKALQDAAKNPAAIVAVFEANAPIKKEQIKYVLGTGRVYQGYIGADMKTLPAEWNVKEKKWVATSAVDAAKQCIGCHVTGYDAAKATWAEDGVRCEACHGPGMAHASSGDKTKILNPKSLAPDKKAMLCGQCHSKGTDTTKTYAFPVNYKAGEDLSKYFIAANSATAGRNQQYSELKGSKHFANGVVCVTCHEPHGAGTTEPFQLRKPIIDTCLECHAVKDMKTHAPSAPAGSTCATCHMPGARHTFKKPGA